MTPEMGAAAAAQMDASREELEPWQAETTYLNFAERDIPGDNIFGPYAHHRLRAVKAAYDPADRIFGPYAHHRLRAVKAAYDLADVFRSNHPVLPARSV